jgi:hypothetical protein
MKQELTPVPPGYDEITPDVVRKNALMLIVWHGPNAEAVAMETAKEALAEGDLKCAEIKMRIVREISRQMKRNKPKLMEKYAKCQQTIEEGQKRIAQARGR